MVRSSNFFKYSIDHESIKTYPYRSFKWVYIFIAGLFAALGLTFMLLLISSVGTVGIVLTVVAPALLFSPFGIASTLQVDFNLQDRKVYKRVLGMKFLFCSFDEIDRIELNANDAGGLNYKLFSTSDSYGKGLNLTSPVRASKQKILENFESECLPLLTKLKGTGASNPVIPTSMQDLKYYRVHGNKVICKSSKWIALIIFCIGATVATYLIGNHFELQQYWFPLVFAIGGLYWLTEQIYFDTEQSQLIEKHFGLKMRNFDIVNFSKFLVERTTSRGFYAGTDVRLRFIDQQGKSRSVKIRSTNKTKDIQDFLDETQYIIKHC